MDEDNDKKRKRQEDEKEESKVEAPASSTSPSSTSLYNSLQRPQGQGMKPKSILMGIYGPRGEKIRHVVHEGALKLPGAAIDILQQQQQACVHHGATASSFELPTIDGVLRPSMDNQHHKAIVITELTSEERPPPQPVVQMVMNTFGQMVPSVMEQPPPSTEKWQTHARNWKLKLPSPENNTEERIRGGGEDDGEDVEMKDAQGETQTTPSAITDPTQVPSPLATSVSEATAASTTAGTIASTTDPTTVVSNNTGTSTTKVPAVIPLPKKPEPQYEQHVPPPNDEMQSEDKTTKPCWYNADKVSELERTMLPEWFNGSAIHRSEETYKQARERMIEISDKLGQRYLTATLVRRTVAGDAGSLLRLHNFLTTWGFINEDSINDSAPTAPGMREDVAAGSNRYGKSGIVWNDTSREELMDAVVDESSKKSKRRKQNDETSSTVVPVIDWEVVSKRIGNGASADECEKVFLALPLEAAAQKVEERSITPDVTSSEQKDDGEHKSKMNLGDQILKDIIYEARPEVVKAATGAALAATDNVAEAQKAGLLALVASEAAVRAKKEEETVSRLLAELQEQRLEKLENRMALLDDVEGVLEAERVALELERRDLYTARCRHWFGGAS